jgi:hypothetical protein
MAIAAVRPLVHVVTARPRCGVRFDVFAEGWHFPQGARSPN